MTVYDRKHLLKQKAKLGKSELFLEYNLSELEKRVKQVTTETEALKQIECLLQLLHDLQGKHNGIIRKRITAIDTKLRKCPYLPNDEED